MEGVLLVLVLLPLLVLTEPSADPAPWSPASFAYWGSVWRAFSRVAA